MIKLDLQFFGGRGAGAGGTGLGNSSQNTFDWDEKSDVMSYRDTDVIHGTTFRDEVMETVKEIYDDFPELTDVVTKEIVAEIKGASGVMAFWSHDGTFAINETYASPILMNQAYDDCVKNGFHPSRGDKTGEQAVTAHEFGHALTSLAEKKSGLSFDEVARRVVVNAMAKVNQKNAVTFGGNISGYAKESNAECIAESYSDVYCNGSKAKAESKAVVAELKKYL